MANPYKDAANAKKTPPGSKGGASKEKTVEVKKEVVEEKPVKKAAPEKKEKDIFANLNTDKPAGKTYAFYLSDENVDKLKEKAKKKGISASKLLDHILSEVL